MRRLKSFGSYLFPSAYMQEQQPDYSGRVALWRVPGAHGAFDPYGDRPWPLNEGRITYRWLVCGSTKQATDALIDEVAHLPMLGEQKLVEVLEDGSERYTWAKVEGRPQIVLGYQYVEYFEVTATFVQRLPYWFVDAMTVTQAVAATPTTFNVTQNGNEESRQLVLTLKPNGAAGYTQPVLRNVTNNHRLQIMHTATDVNNWVRVDMKRGTIEESTDGGITWQNAYKYLLLPATQIDLFRLEAGSNEISYTDNGTPSLTITLDYAHTYSR